MSKDKSGRKSSWRGGLGGLGGVKAQREKAGEEEQATGGGRPKKPLKPRPRPKGKGTAASAMKDFLNS